MIYRGETKTNLDVEIDTESTAYANVVGLMHAFADEVMKPNWDFHLAICKFCLWEKAMMVLANESVKD